MSLGGVSLNLQIDGHILAPVPHPDMRGQHAECVIVQRMRIALFVQGSHSYKERL